MKCELIVQGTVQKSLTPLDAVEVGMAEKSREFLEKGAEIYHEPEAVS